jgi:hypothetical protein
VTDVNISGESATIGVALDLILKRVRDYELTWIVKGERILITTVEHSETDENLFLRTYDISSLRSLTFPGSTIGSPVLPSSAGTDAMGGMPPSQQGHSGRGSLSGTGLQTSDWADSLTGLIVEMTSPMCLWKATGDGIGTVRVVGNRLMVLQSRRGHVKVVDVLEQLEIAASETSAATAMNPSETMIGGGMMGMSPIGTSSTAEGADQ